MRSGGGDFHHCYTHLHFVSNQLDASMCHSSLFCACGCVFLCFRLRCFGQYSYLIQVSKDGFERMGFEYAKRMRQDELDKCRNGSLSLEFTGRV